MRKNRSDLFIIVFLLLLFGLNITIITVTAQLQPEIDPKTLAPHTNLPDNLKIIAEINKSGYSVGAEQTYSVYYRSDDKKSFGNIAIIKYADESEAFKNKDDAAKEFTVAFEETSGNKFSKAGITEIRNLASEKYSVVVLGDKGGIVVNLYILQIDNYVFLVSGGSESYDDIAFDLASLINFQLILPTITPSSVYPTTPAQEATPIPSVIGFETSLAIVVLLAVSYLLLRKYK